MTQLVTVSKRREASRETHPKLGEKKMFNDLETKNFESVAVKTTAAANPCPRCHATGKYTYRNGKTFPCGKCRSTGYLKSTPAQRSKSRVYSANAKAKKVTDNLALFAELQPAAYQWLTTARGDFPASLLGGVKKYGSLTEGQLQAVFKCIARDEDRAAQVEKTSSQTQIDMTDLLERFALAQDAGIKRPKVNTGDLLFSLAPAAGRNANHVYVKGPKDAWDERPYLGKITPQGRFYPSKVCDQAAQQRVAEIGSDVVSAAKAHGAQHNNCCFCSRDLTTNESVSNGYGPVCADRYGLPWDVRPEFLEAKAALKKSNKAAA
jgi:hypothetical protein